MTLVGYFQIHDSAIFVQDIEWLVTIPRSEKVWLLLARMIDAYNRAKPVTLFHALRNECLVDDDGRAVGTEVASRGEHDPWRSIGGVDDVSHLLPGRRVATRAPEV
jgi:hypothetical protein